MTVKLHRVSLNLFTSANAAPLKARPEKLRLKPSSDSLPVDPESLGKQ